MAAAWAARSAQLGAAARPAGCHVALTKLALRFGSLPLLLGQTISVVPMLIMYLQLAIIVGCVALFVASALVGNKILERTQSAK